MALVISQIVILNIGNEFHNLCIPANNVCPAGEKNTELMYQYTHVKFQQSMCITHTILYRYGFPCAIHYFRCN